MLTPKQKQQRDDLLFLNLMTETGRIYVATNLYEAFSPIELAECFSHGLEIIHASYLASGTALAAKPYNLPFNLGTLWENPKTLVNTSGFDLSGKVSA